MEKNRNTNKETKDPKQKAPPPRWRTVYRVRVEPFLWGGAYRSRNSTFVGSGKFLTEENADKAAQEFLAQEYARYPSFGSEPIGTGRPMSDLISYVGAFLDD